MSTTAIFAELLVAGIGALSWIVLLVLALVPGANAAAIFEAVEKWETLAAALALAIAYVVGVVADRIIDSILDPIDLRFRDRILGERYPVADTRVRAAQADTQLGEYLAYIRTRMRVARGASVNLLMLTYAGVLFLTRHNVGGRPILALVLTGVTASALAFWAWRRIAFTFYKRIHGARKILKLDIPDELLVVEDGGVRMAIARTAAHRHGMRHPSVHLLCYNGSGVYLQRRAPDRKRNPGLWTSTVSGHIASHDARTWRDTLVVDERAARRALKRETEEEIGWTWPWWRRGPKLLGIVDDESHGGGEVCRGKAYVFAIEVEELSVVPNGELAELGFFPFEDIESALNGEELRGHGLADNFEVVFRVLRPRDQAIAAGQSQPKTPPVSTP